MIAISNALMSFIEKLDDKLIIVCFCKLYFSEANTKDQYVISIQENDISLQDSSVLLYKHILHWSNLKDLINQPHQIFDTTALVLALAHPVNLLTYTFQ